MNWIIDGGHSIAEFSIKHLMVTTVKGRFKTVAGKVFFDPANPTASTVDVTIEAGSIDTNHEKRDSDLKSPLFFDVEQYPTLTFKSTQVEKIDDETFKVVGDLTIHGITNSVVLDVEYAGQATNHFGGRVAGFSAKTVINRKNFGLNWNVALEAGGVVIGEKVTINLEIELNPQPATVASA
jgi:polyisoprenoid-binding protein YceI